MLWFGIMHLFIRAQFRSWQFDWERGRGEGLIDDPGDKPGWALLELVCLYSVNGPLEWLLECSLTLNLKNKTLLLSQL